jgi:hypothetical protein
MHKTHTIAVSMLVMVYIRRLGQKERTFLIGQTTVNMIFWKVEDL